MAEITLRVNGQNHKVAVDDPNMPLLYALRDDLGLRGPKFGCGLGQCGACCVLIDGAAARSCVTLAVDAREKEIMTLEGLGDPSRPSRVQAAFIAEQAAQCGYCTNGMIIGATRFSRACRIPRKAKCATRWLRIFVGAAVTRAWSPRFCARRRKAEP